MDTQCFLCRNVFLSYNKQTSFNHKNVTPNQYNDTFWVQNKIIVHTLHLKVGFCESMIL